MTNSFWRGRRVFVTGHTGFKGAWLTLWLSHVGAEVTGYALAPATTPNLYGEARVDARCRSLFGDIRDRAELQRALAEAEPEIVFHLAAQAVVRASYADPVGTFETNVIGTVNLLEGLRTLESVSAAVIVTSDKCYANPGTGIPFRESGALGGDDPYSASKACAEIVTAAYRTSFMSGRKAIASARAGNVIGGGDWSQDRLVPDIVRAMQNGAVVQLRAPSSTRPWQHVLEPLHGYMELARHLAQGCCKSAAYNFGPPAGEIHSVAALTEELIAQWRGGTTWEPQPGNHPREQQTLVLDTTLASAELGVCARLTFAQTCRWTAEWYMRFASGEDARALCMEQVARYEELR